MTQNVGSLRRNGGQALSLQITVLPVQLIGLVVLARILRPADFGLVAMVGVFMALAQLLLDSGLPMATLQAKSLNHTQASNMFWLNLATGFIAGGALLAAAPLMATLYSEPKLVTIVPWFAVVAVLTGAQVQLQTQIARDMRFRLLGWTALTAQVLALTGAIGIALLGFGFWALVFQPLIQVFILFILRWITSGKRFSRPSRDPETFRLLKSSYHYGAAQFLDWAAQSSAPLILGITNGPTVLGYFDRALQLTITPLKSILGQLTQIVVPATRSSMSQGNSLVGVLIRMQAVLGTLALWGLGVAILIAPMFTPALLGSQWSAASPIIQLFCLVGIFQIFNYSSFWSFLILAASREQLRYAFWTRIMAIIIIPIGGLFGLTGIAIAIGLNTLINGIVGMIWVRFRLRVEIGRLARGAIYYIGIVLTTLLFTLFLCSSFFGDLKSTPAAFSALALFSAFFFSSHLLTRFGRSAIEEMLLTLRHIVLRAKPSKPGTNY